MKKLLGTFVLVLVDMTAYSQSGHGVMINGIEWATHNVGDVGEFVTNPQDYGNYYTYDEAQTVCPSGWRVPTQQEFESLIKSGREWAKMGDVVGCLFGSDNNTIFLPLAGQRDYVRGKLERQKEFGYYWCKSNYGGMEHYLFLDLGRRVTASYLLTIETGCTIRCVRITE